jgi:protein-L-isoaspartate(D-aspartate) O-methyltransferase
MRRSLFILVGLLALSCSGKVEKGAEERRAQEPDYSKLRQQMVETQIVSRGVSDSLVLAAMRAVPRHLFVPPKLRQYAYTDQPLPIGQDQTISQPYIVALMTELLELRGGEKVLEVGTGSGYQAAVLSEIAGEVYTIEILEELATSAARRLDSLSFENVHVLFGDGYRGWPENEPFDAIIVTAAPEHIPEPLKEQLKVGGRLVIPVGDIYQELVVVTRTEEGYESKSIIPVRFVPMTGEAQKREKGD